MQHRSGPSLAERTRACPTEGKYASFIGHTYLAGAGGDAGEEAAGSELLVEERVQVAVGLALGQLALDVVRLGGDLERVAEGTGTEGGRCVHATG